MRNRPLMLCGKDLEKSAVQSCVRRKQGIEGTNPSFDGVGILAPIDAPSFFLDQWRVGRFGLVLWTRDQLPTFQQLKCLAQGASAEYRELVVQGATGVVGCDRKRLLQEDVSRVHTLADVHDRHAGFSLPAGNRPLDRCSSAVFG